MITRNLKDRTEAYASSSPTASFITIITSSQYRCPNAISLIQPTSACLKR